MGRKLGLPADRVVTTVDRHANTSAASIPLALADAWVGGRIARGELLVLQGRPRLPFEKVLVFGLGRKADFSEAVFVAEVKHISSALEGLRVAHAVVELPGRPDGMIAPERAAELLVASITSEAHDSWALVEDAEGQKRLGAKLEADRRHTRRS